MWFDSDKEGKVYYFSYLDNCYHGDYEIAYDAINADDGSAPFLLNKYLVKHAPYSIFSQDEQDNAPANNFLNPSDAIFVLPDFN
jgi:hypothetical protein